MGIPRSELTARRAVYVGNTAAISFLQFLRETMRQCAGPSTFTESHERHTMLEATVQRDGPGDFRDDLECRDKINLIQHFQHAVGLPFTVTYLVWARICLTLIPDERPHISLHRRRRIAASCHIKRYKTAMQWCGRRCKPGWSRVSVSHDRYRCPMPKQSGV